MISKEQSDLFDHMEALADELEGLDDDGDPGDEWRERMREVIEALRATVTR
jgi:hypothetical protein